MLPAPSNRCRINRTHLIKLTWSAILPILIAALHYGCVHQVHAVAIITLHRPVDDVDEGISRHGGSNQHNQHHRPPHDDTHIFTSATFPATVDLQPTLANGHLGFTVFDDTVYMNGLYNGLAGLSHRARIPNWAMLRMAAGCDDRNGSAGCRAEFRLNVRLATFEEEQWHGDRFRVVHRVYAHRFHSRAIVNEFFVHRMNFTGVVNVRLQRIDGNASISQDISFEPASPVIGLSNHGVTSRCGYTNEAEDLDFYRQAAAAAAAAVDRHVVVFNNDTDDDSDGGVGVSAASDDDVHRCDDCDDNNVAGAADGTQPVCVLWNHVPEEITLSEDVQVMSARFVMTVDGRLNVAEQEMMDVLNAGEGELFERHIGEWRRYWSEFGITVDGDPELARTIAASLFYLASSLPSTVSNLLANPFDGLSPTGLPKGGSRLDDYEGHSMWDTEIWMFPVVLLMNPTWTEQLLEYRFRRLDAAIRFALSSGHKGARFPWESAHTGRDVTQPCCPLVAQHQVHVSADIAFAIRNHFAATGDTSWLSRVGCPMADEIATFWASRAIYNETTHFYDINDVMGPDEDHDGVSNNGYTNVAAGFSLYFADFATCICDQSLLSPSTNPPSRTFNFSSIAAHLKLPHDTVLHYTPQFDGYARETIIKQADTVLVGYPLLYSALSPTVQSNNVAYYERLTRDSGPAMTWSMHAVNRLQLMRNARRRRRNDNTVVCDSGGVDGDEKQQADAMFRRGYQGYVRPPFMVWNEVLATEATGATNFLTGAGGFLQSVINGYAGLKLRLDGLYIERPRLPGRVQFLSLTGIRYLGSKFRLDIQRDTQVLLECIGPMADALVLRLSNGTEVRVVERKQYDITHSAVSAIRAQQDVHKGCPLPADIIGQPKNY